MVCLSLVQFCSGVHMLSLVILFIFNEVSIGTSVLIFLIFNQNNLLWSGETPCHKHSINVLRVGVDLPLVWVYSTNEKPRFL